MIEDEIQAVFDKLVKEHPNASFVFSYVYASTKNPKTATALGRVNMTGSVEEVEIHIEELQKALKQQKEFEKEKKAKIYGSKKN